MKTINGIKSVQIDKPNVGEITILATYGDQEFSHYAQCHSSHEFPKANKRWSRAHRVTEAAFFLVRNAAKGGIVGVAILQDVLSKISIALENELTWPPIFNEQPAWQTISVGGKAIFSIKVCTELPDEMPVVYGWFQSKDGKDWTPLSDNEIYSGSQTESITVTGSDVSLNGFRFCCKATNGSGSTTSEIAALIINQNG